MKIDLPVVQENPSTARVTFQPKKLPDFDTGGTPLANVYAYFRALLAAVYEVAPEREMMGADGRFFKAKFAVSPAAMLQVDRRYEWTIVFGLDDIESSGEAPLPVVVAFMLGWCGWYDDERK